MPTPLVLLTGFEPFAGAATNPSWEAVQEAATLLGDGATPGPEEGLIDVRTLLLPVEFGRAGSILVEHLRALTRASEPPRLVVATGLASGRTAITPERVAINVRDARIPDNAGASPIDEPCVPGAGVGWFSTLPIKAMALAAREAGAPASVSQTAGTYVCNDVFCLLMDTLASDPALGGTRGGFIHVPDSEVLDAASAGRALAAMVRAALACPQDVAATGGAEH